MTTFQLLALGFLGVSILAAYSQDIMAAVRPFVPVMKPASRPEATPPAPSPAAQDAVNDMILVADLRDRLHTAGCQGGVNACTQLLQVLVEFKYPQG